MQSCHQQGLCSEQCERLQRANGTRRKTRIRHCLSVPSVSPRANPRESLSQAMPCSSINLNGAGKARQLFAVPISIRSVWPFSRPTQNTRRSQGLDCSGWCHEVYAMIAPHGRWSLTPALRCIVQRPTNAGSRDGYRADSSEILVRRAE